MCSADGSTGGILILFEMFELKIHKVGNAIAVNLSRFQATYLEFMQKYQSKLKTNKVQTPTV
jgi:hypothetical protein